MGYTTKEKHRGDPMIRAAHTKEWLWLQLGASNTKQEEILKSTTQKKRAWEATAEVRVIDFFIVSVCVLDLHMAFFMSSPSLA